MHKVKTDVEKQKDEEEYRKWMSGHKGGVISKGIFQFVHPQKIRNQIIAPYLSNLFKGF